MYQRVPAAGAALGTAGLDTGAGRAGRVEAGGAVGRGGVGFGDGVVRGAGADAIGECVRGADGLVFFGFGKGDFGFAVAGDGEAGLVLFGEGVTEAGADDFDTDGLTSFGLGGGDAGTGSIAGGVSLGFFSTEGCSDTIVCVSNAGSTAAATAPATAIPKTTGGTFRRGGGAA